MDLELKTGQSMDCLAIEMETAELYTLAAKYNVEALSILTISDHIFKGERNIFLKKDKYIY